MIVTNCLLHQSNHDEEVIIIEKNNVTVVDCIMGAGKTSYAIQYINDNPCMSFVYCTPFLKEVDRITRECLIANFKQPTYKSGRKIDDFNQLLMNGENIVLTHSTFENANDDTIEFIKNNDYILILDETLNTLETFNSVCSDRSQEVDKGDIKILFDKQLISVDEYGRVSWIDNKSYHNSHFADVEKYAKNGTLLYLDKTFFVWEFPSTIFKLFSHVYILTYMFDGSVMKPYFEYHSIGYEKKSVIKNTYDHRPDYQSYYQQTDDDVFNRYELVEYTPDHESIIKCKKLITIYQNDKSNDYRGTSLSKTWYEKNTKKLPELKNHLRNFFVNHMHAKSKDILWTCTKKYLNNLKGYGYGCVRQLTYEEKHSEQREEIEKRLSCFLSCNAKATNDYADRSVLAYCVNMFSNPFIKRYFTNKNTKDGTHIEVDEDLFALSNMLQWIFRSQIRNEKEITIYIPSKRMRTLLERWLNLEW